ncbi:MAG: hypothetical protein QM718_10655 [Steroidobacteraceae bacterium]
MKSGLSLCITAMLLAASTAGATDLTPILSNGPARSEREERANKAMGLMLSRTLFSEGDPLLAADIVMDANFVNHDVEEPSGADNFAGFFITPEKYGNPGGSRSSGPKAAAPTALRRLFIITDGDLTMMAYPTQGGDPGRRFASNMMETKRGRVTQWWFSGPTQEDRSALAGKPIAPLPSAPPPAKAPAAASAAAQPKPAATPPDFTQWYPESGNTTVSMQSVIPLGAPTSREQRDANKKMVVEFLDAFFNRKDDSAATRYLAADLRNHGENQPSGESFARFARANPDKVAPSRVDSLLFTIAEGELVAVGYPAPINGDPGAWYAQNLFRVRDGKIVEWWYSGFPYGSPRYANPWNKLGYSPAADKTPSR